MAIKVSELGNGKVLELEVTGKLTHGDYQQFIPEVERLMQQHGKLNLLMEMLDFHGWKMSAFWDDFRFGMKHHADFGRIAMVGDKKWEKRMAALCRPLTGAKVRYFDKAELEAARTWVAAS